MHLREVQVENFKSFGRKLAIPFEPGFTGITGPNGSGKSNIGDAVMFVLGPNTPRAIRAGRLTDLIFNGGQNGKPANKCTVSLVFDNLDRAMPVDEDTVTLTRKVKRTPSKDDPDAYKSYFYVNGRASKKKEFVDLLRHARISADGYNITQQGDVLQICQMSNVERRKILDDMAGVTTFDKDINAANNKREMVEDNLERIGIVLEEIARNLKQLESEKGAAQKYKDLQEAIGRLKGQMAHRRKADLEGQLAGVRQQIADHDEKRKAHEEKLRGLNDEYSEAQRRFTDVQAQIRREGGDEVAKIQEKLKEIQANIVRFEEKIQFAKQSIEAAKDDIAPLEQELRSLEKERGRTELQANQQREAHEKATEELANAKSAHEAAQKRISQSDKGAMELQKELSRLKHDYEQGQTDLHETRLQAERIDKRINDLEDSLVEARAAVDSTDNDLKEITWNLEELQANEQGDGKKRKDAERKLFALRKEQAELSSQTENLEGKIRRSQRELADLRAQQDAAARMQGAFGGATEAVINLRDSGQVQGIVGTIAELADAAPEHQEALQTAAGGRMQAVVVEDDSVAAQCIEYVKKNRLGRVTLLPLTKMVASRPRGQALMKQKKDGCLGFALDLITYNQRYHNAFWYVFGDTLVARDMNAGRAMMGGVRIVTLDGELFEASGAMTGGASKKRGGPSFSNSDRGRLDELLAEIATAENAQENIAIRMQEVRQEILEQEAVLAAEGREGASAEDRIKDLKKRHGEGTEKLKIRRGKLERLEAEFSDLGRQYEEALAAIGELEKKLGDMEKVRQEKGQLLLKGTKKELREEVERLEAKIRSATEDALSAESRAATAAKQVEMFDSRIKEIKDKIAGTDNGDERHREDIKRHTESLKACKIEEKALLKMEKEASKELAGLHDEKDRIYKQLVDLDAQKDKVATRMETAYSLLQQAKSKEPVIEESLADAMLELKENPVSEEDLADLAPYDELKRALRGKETSLSNLGPVNMRALEDYDEEKRRRDDLQEEQDRLVEQRAELDKLVEEITTKKKAALMEVFIAINENFAKVYSRLSLGGAALMELENPENPFEGGLILKAQPKGKRVTRLDSLSGGEKSLTSMAFIFALQMYDPSPFYYFDEVDQNLDAVNSELLAKLVRDNSQFAQFIVVSLRKITLKEANHIYGVTQQTPGQSEIIANFDIDTLPGDEKDNAASGNDGEDGDAPPPEEIPVLMESAGTKSAKRTKETTITSLMDDMVQVKVEK